MTETDKRKRKACFRLAAIAIGPFVILLSGTLQGFTPQHLGVAVYVGFAVSAGASVYYGRFLLSGDNNREPPRTAHRATSGIACVAVGIVTSLGVESLPSEAREITYCALFAIAITVVWAFLIEVVLRG